MCLQNVVTLRWLHICPNVTAAELVWTILVLPTLQSAVGWEYQTELSKHESQTDSTKGFGGRYGVQKDRQDDVRYPKPSTRLLGEEET